MTILCTLSSRGENTRAAKDQDRARIIPALLAKLGSPQNIPTVRDEHGRLCFPPDTALDLNLSHANPLTAYAVGNTRVGIDLEAPDRLRAPLSLARRFFTDRERGIAEQADHPALAVCEIWTKKEALAKYIGTGLAANIHLDTTHPPDGVTLTTHRVRKDGRLYILTLCAHRDATVTFIEQNELLI